MVSSNYLVNFLQDVDGLILQINKLNNKTALYRKNCEKFGINFDVKFSISPYYFNTLRDFLLKKIKDYCGYNRQIVNLRRELLRNIPFIIATIQKEIARIDYIQKSQINDIVYNAIYDAKILTRMAPL